MASSAQASHYCSICNVRCGAESDLTVHLRGERHSGHIRTRVSLDVTGVKCAPCDQYVFGERNGWQGHCSSKFHKQNTSAIAGYTTPDYDACPEELVVTAALRCSLCNLTTPEHRWRHHAQSQRHLENASRALTTSATPQIPPPVRPSASAPTSSGITASQPTSQPQTRRCDVCNISMHISDWSPHIQGARHRAAASAGSQSNIVPPPRPNYRPQYSSTHGAHPRTSFPVRSFWRGGRRSRGDQIIPGIAPSQKNLIPWTTKLDEYPIPEDFEKETVYAVPPELTFEIYTDSWKKLMLTEEIKQRDDLSAFDLHDVPLMKHGHYYHVKVPGLAEKRPSVMVGDSVGVRPAGCPDEDPWFEGYVHYVHQSEVGLKFFPNFRQKQGNHPYNVRFELNRTNMRRMYQALFITLEEENAKRILFPRNADFRRVPMITQDDIDSTRPHIVNQSILGNPRQLLAVTAIKERPAGTPPLIIWGPPGTGKTVTAVEGMRQILLKDPKARILACAPSNSATDAIAKNLMDLGVETVFRLNAPSRPVKALPIVLERFSSIFELRSRYPSDSEFYDTDGPYRVFSCPPKEKLMQFRVVVSTSSQSGVPGGIGFPRGHFTHIFFDEAAQALEPEVMIAIKTMADSQTNIILCGDHKQLRPVVFSPIARTLAYGRSYIERLVSSPGYNIILGNCGVSMVRLNQNFRSHASLVEFPSQHVYDGELRACGPPEIINSFQNWSGLPRKRFPIIFHGVKGINLQTERSPSWYNPKEADIVKYYMDKLWSSSPNISILDVGIISPYQAQCGTIRELVYPNIPRVEQCKIGSVEEFQGDERKVIIVSTVRSDYGIVKKFDRKHGLGFVAQASRLNVAITRAMALLIVIGDPTVLATDPLWLSFLDFVRDGGGWRGAPIHPDAGDDSE